MFSGTIMAASVQSGFGSIAVTEVDFQAADGSMIHSTLQRPNYATDTNPLPGVVVIHGSLQSKEWLMAFGIELARRGFVTLTIDANGHGNSDPGSGAGIAAVEYLADLDFVDSSSIGMIGHSMGGGYVWSAVNYSSVVINSVILVGSGPRQNMTYNPNTLMAIGDFDSLLTRYTTNLTRLEWFFNVTDIELGVTYGDFASGTARRIVLARTNHLMETIHPKIVSESIEWMKDSLKGGVEDSHWIPSSQLIYSFWLLGGLISLAGLLLTIFPLFVIFLGHTFFSAIKSDRQDAEPTSNRSFLGFGLLFSVLGVALFYPMLIFGGVLSGFIPSPSTYSVPVMTWMIGSGLILLFVLSFVLRRRDSGSLKDILALNQDSGVFIDRFVRVLLMGVIIVGWLYMWTIVVDWGFALDLRCFLPGLNDLTFLQSVFVPLYFVAFLVYFVQEGAWYGSILKSVPEGGFFKSQLNWTLKALFVKCVPYLVLIGIEYGGGLLTGVAIVPGMIGYSFLFFYAFLPWFAVTTALALWGERLSNSLYPAAIVNALMCAWLLATIMAL
jgi:pimeloyl-ACP methyl ester carboxylesterase